MNSNFGASAGFEIEKPLTVLINDNGDINVHSEDLQSLLESSSSVTFMKISETDSYVFDPENVIEESSIENPSSLLLDSDELNKLENVLLESEEAKEFLNGVWNPSSSASSSASSSNLLSQTEQVLSSIPQLDDHTYNAELSNYPDEKKENKTTRRSQRQMDKEMKEEAAKIRLENQAIMKKESEEANRNYSSSITVIEISNNRGDSQNGGRPKRERKLPAHLKTGDFESTMITRKPEVKEVETDDDENSEGDWNSEDDPERLWCLCNQPHNNRFMISCDYCQYWFHGKCVGISKKLGKEMEASLNDWKCPKCISSHITKEKESTQISISVKSKGKKDIIRDGEYRKKPTRKKCFVCENLPRSGSIFCSDDCIYKHAAKAKALLNKATPQPLIRSNEESRRQVQVLVLEPKSNTLLNGPNAPTEEKLESWLKSHPTYHVVMPRVHPTNKFYGHTKGNNNSVHRTQSKMSSSGNSSFSEVKILSQNPVSRAPEKKKKRQETEENGVKKKSRNNDYFSSNQYVCSDVSITKIPGKIESKRTDISVPYEEIRENAKKGIYDALKSRLQDGSEYESGLESLVSEIEAALFSRLEIGPKYKNRYRSLVFNIRDEKNSGLYRKILSGEIKPRDVVYLTPSQMANKELQLWRQKELKADIEKIKSHEYNKMTQKNFKMIIKSHKGDLDIDSEELDSMNDVKISEKENDDDKMCVSQTHNFESSSSQYNERKEESLIKTSQERVAQTKEILFHSDHHYSKKSENMENVFKDSFSCVKTCPEQKSILLKSDPHHSSSKKEIISEHSDQKRVSKTLKLDSLSSKNGVVIKNSSSSSSTSKNRHHHNSSKNHHHHNSSKNRHHRDNSSKDRHRDSSKNRHYRDNSSKDCHHRDNSSKDCHHRDNSSKDRHHRDNSSKDRHHRDNSSKDRHHDDSSKHRHRSHHSSSKIKKTSSSSQHLQNAIGEYTKIEFVNNKNCDILKESNSSSSSVKEVVSKVQTVSSSSSSLLRVEKSWGQREDKSPNEEVSSTVTINNPTRLLDSETFWKGNVIMPEVSKFRASASALSSTSPESLDLSLNLKIIGRIDPIIVWKYVTALQETCSKEILLLKILSSNSYEYSSLVSYLIRRNRFGVLGPESLGKGVKDCYIIPLSSSEGIHEHLKSYANGHSYLDKWNHPDILLALLIRARRRQKKTQSQVLKQSDDLLTLNTKNEELKEVECRKREMAEEIYDPESAFPPFESSVKKSCYLNDVKGPITSNSGGFTEQLAKLSQEIEKQKKDIENMEKNDVFSPVSSLNFGAPGINNDSGSNSGSWSQNWSQPPPPGVWNTDNFPWKTLADRETNSSSILTDPFTLFSHRTK